MSTGTLPLVALLAFVSVLVIACVEQPGAQYIGLVLEPIPLSAEIDPDDVCTTDTDCMQKFPGVEF